MEDSLRNSRKQNITYFRKKFSEYDKTLIRDLALFRYFCHILLENGFWEAFSNTPGVFYKTGEKNGIPSTLQRNFSGFDGSYYKFQGKTLVQKCGPKK